MWFLTLQFATTASAGCRGEIAHTRSAWRDLALQVPAAETGIDPLAEKLTALQEHAAIDAELTNALRKRARPTLPAATSHARAWLATNEGSRGAVDVVARLDVVALACGL